MSHRGDHSLQFKITLKGVRPPIWRRIQVPSSYSFWDLHVAMQDAMGWLDYHLHAFQLRSPAGGPRVEIGIPSDEPYLDLRETLPGWEIAVPNYFTLSNRRATYLYDFGDGWKHSVVLEKIEPLEDSRTLPVCLSGRRHSPPEDCGGIGGYRRFLEIIGDPTHEEHEDMLVWVGGSFDPEHFDKNSIRFDDPHERWRLAFEYESGEIETGRIRVGVDERIPVALSFADRQLIMDYAFGEPDLVDRLRLSEIRDGELRVGFTLSELDELLGYIAAEANHTKDATLEESLDALFGKLKGYDDRYEDELSPGVN